MESYCFGKTVYLKLTVKDSIIFLYYKKLRQT